MLQMIHHAASTFNLPQEIMKALYSHLIPVKNHQQCIPIASELDRELGTNDCKPNALSIMLAGLILNDSSNINTT